MPPRTVMLVPGGCYHLFNRGCAHQPLFFETENYLFFLRELKPRCREYGVEVLAWCLMPNHYHLLIRPQSDRCSEMMHAFLTCYTKAINKRHHRTGTLFEGRFQAIEVDNLEYLIHLSRYIHLNPVAAGIVNKPQDYEYSSYRDYLGLRRGTLAQPEPILTEFSSVEEYRLFVESGIGRRDAVIENLTIDDDRG